MDAAEIFEQHRPRLFAIASRMLRAHADAEDILQDVYVRWHESATGVIHSPLGFLITITTRLCLDSRRSLKRRNSNQMGAWPLVVRGDDCAPSPEEEYEWVDEVSSALNAVLERLGPNERAAFLLREVLDCDYPDVAQMVGKSEAACRQMVRRALPRVREARTRAGVAAESRERAIKKLLIAIGMGDRQTVLALLRE